jgi:hypothetical protein
MLALPSHALSGPRSGCCAGNRLQGEIPAMLASVCLQGDVGREARFWGGDRGTARFPGAGAW